MRATSTVNDDLLIEAKEISGLPETATVEDVLRHFVEGERRQRALNALEGTGWDGPATAVQPSRRWRKNFAG